MLTSIYAKTVRDRWLSSAISATTLALFLWMGMAVYRQIDLAIYHDLPEAMRAVMGIPDGADAAALAFGAIYSAYGALTLGGVAISFGSASIAGEEQDGTIGLLLSAPRTRTHVLLSKAGALLTLVTVAALVLLAAGYAVPAALGVDVGASHVSAVVLHLWVNTLFYGALAMAVGAVTGRRPLANGVAAGVMALGFVLNGVLPLVGSVADLVRVLPWYYYAGSTPLVNGADAGHLAVLAGGIVLLLGAAVVCLRRRDLRTGNPGRSLIDRLRAHPLTQVAVERMAGSTRVSAIWLKTTSEHQGLLAIVALLMFWMMGLLMGPMYVAIDDALATFSESMPEVLLAIAGGGDVSTPEGWYQLETFGLMAPAAVMALTVTLGARALAGEEQRRTMGLLLASPITRRHVVLQKAQAMVVLALAVGVATGLGVVAGSAVAGLGMSALNIAATSLQASLLGLFFGGVALLLGAATGRTRIATFGTVGIALAAYLAEAMLPLAESVAGWSRWSPFHYYLSADPLNAGVPWGHAALLVGLFVVTVVGAVVAFDRRDLRQG